MMLRLATFCCSLLAAGALSAQEPPKPGPEHEYLKKHVGRWDCTIKSMGQESKGTSVYRMDLGGLWLSSNFNGDFGGMKFQGRGMDTYDAAKKKYVGYWFDSMSTGVMVLEGTLDEKTQTLTMTGTGPGPGGGAPTKFKSTSQMTGPDTMVFKMYIVTDGGEMEMMTIDYKKSADQGKAKGKGKGKKGPNAAEPADAKPAPASR